VLRREHKQTNTNGAPSAATQKRNPYKVKISTYIQTHA
jgi:hypothetical protein